MDEENKEAREGTWEGMNMMDMTISHSQLSWDNMRQSPGDPGHSLGPLS
jgi:hypothetical protein